MIYSTILNGQHTPFGKFLEDLSLPYYNMANTIYDKIKDKKYDQIVADFLDVYAADVAYR